MGSVAACRLSRALGALGEGGGEGWEVGGSREGGNCGEDGGGSEDGGHGGEGGEGMAGGGETQGVPKAVGRPPYSQS